MFQKVNPTIEVSLDKLIPFENYPIEKLRGKLLRDARDELCGTMPYEPITVRELNPDSENGSNVSYGIIKGHYLVAAAKTLGWTTIRAINIGWYSDEEALELIPTGSPVGLLYKLGIDIYCDNYKESEGYKRAATYELYLDDSEYETSILLTDYIDTYLLENDNAYESKYAMGNLQELNEEDCEYLPIAIDIITAIHNSKNANKVLDERDKRADAENIKAEARDFVNRRLKRKDANYFIQMKELVDLNSEQYNYTNLQCKRERAKILYLLCTLDLLDYPHRKVFELLNKPSMENVDNLLYGWETSNGEIVHHIKTSIEAELSWKEIFKIQDEVSDIWERWNRIIHKARNEIELYADNESILSQIMEDINEKGKLINKPYQVHYPIFSTPLADFYLHIVLLEYLGHVNDTLTILKQAEKNKYEVSEKYWPVMRLFRYTPFLEEDAKWFFTPENAKKIAKYVYLKDENTPEEVRNLYRQDGKSNVREKLIRFLKLWKFSQLGGEHNVLGDVSVLLVLSCLQCIFLDDKNEIFKYSFHSFERVNTSGKFHVQAALKKDESRQKRICDAEKLYWVRKVLDRCYANIGFNDALRAIRSFEMLCYDVVKKIFESSSLEVLNARNDYYLEIVKHGWLD